MLVRISILLAMFAWGFVSACSSFKVQDKHMVPYIEKFTEEMDVEKDDVDKFSVSFLTLPVNEEKKTKILGICNPLTRSITIDPTFWYSMFEPKIRRTALIYHELTHCVCEQYVHDDMIMDDGCPTTIMNTKLPISKCLRKYWDEYVEELQERCY